MALFGISAHKYNYFQNQNVVYLNSNWTPDPIKTTAMSAVVSGNDPVSSVQGYLVEGDGAKFKKAYQYQTKRWKKRICTYSIEHQNTSYTGSVIATGTLRRYLDEKDILEKFPELKNKYYRIDELFNNFTYSGSKFYEYIDTKYHLTDLTEPDSEGRYFVITGLSIPRLTVNNKEDLSTSYQIGYETLENKPLIILDPAVNEENIVSEYYLVGKEKYVKERSRGAVIWISNSPLEDLTIQDEEDVSYTRDAFDLLGMDIHNPNKVEFNRIYVQNHNPYYSSGSVIVEIYDPTLPDEDNKEEIEITNNDEVQIFYRQVKEVKENGDVVVKYFTEVGKIVYDEILYLWVDENGNESHEGLKDYYSEEPVITKQNLYKPNLFKFYGSLPIKQDEQWYINFNEEKTQKYVDAVRERDEKEKEDIEADAPKEDKRGSKDLKKEGRDNSASVRNTLARKDYYQKHIKTVADLYGITEKDHKHLDTYGDLLGIDYKDVAINLKNNENESLVYYASIFPSVRLCSNFDEENKYLWEFWDKIYRTYGQSSYDAFKLGVDALPAGCTYNHLGSLPRICLSYNIDGEKLSSGIYFNYIKKFTISGATTRNTQRKRKADLYEVKSCHLTPLYRLAGDNLKEALLNPNQEFVPVEYYTSKAGKDYPVNYGNYIAGIPGDKLDYSCTADESGVFPEREGIASAVHRAMYALHGYTCIVRPLNNAGDVEVLAIAGLMFEIRYTAYTDWNPDSVDLSGSFIYCRAFNAIDMFYKRNRLKYVEHKLTGEEADVYWKFEDGSKKRKLDFRIRVMDYIPVDYKILSRMSGTSVAKLVPRCMNLYTYTRQMQKKLRGWVGIALKIIGLVISIITAGAGSFATMTAMQIITKVATAIVINLAISQGLKLLVKAFGLKGLAILIALMVIGVVANYCGVFNNMSSLPYASQLPNAQIASNATAQAVNKSMADALVNSVKQSIQDSIKNTLGSFTDSSLKGTISSLSKIADYANQGMQFYIQDEMKTMQQYYKEQTDKYNAHMAELQEIQEMNQELMQPYDIKVVMSNLMNRAKIIEPDIYLQTLLNTDNVYASEEYLSGFLESKLSLDPTTFDSIRSIDFSLGLENT